MNFVLDAVALKGALRVSLAFLFHVYSTKKRIRGKNESE
jgi:hypothetical protein